MYASMSVVSVPDPNQPQRGSLLVSRTGIYWKQIRAGVGLGLGPRLQCLLPMQTNRSLVIVHAVVLIM